MKIILINFLFLCVFINLGFSQQVEVKTFTIDVDINTTDGREGIVIDINLDTAYVSYDDNDTNRIIDVDDFYYNKTNLPEIELRSSSSDEMLLKIDRGKRTLGAGATFIQIKFTDEKAAPMLDLLKAGDIRMYIHISKKLEFKLNDGTNMFITPQKMKEISGKGFPKLTDVQIDEIVDKLGGYNRLSRTYLDGGLDINDTTSSEATGFLKYGLIFNTFFPRNSFELSGLISSDNNDVASRLSFSPIVYRIYEREYSIFGKATFEFNQSGSDYRLFGALFGQFICPNFVDLTGNYKRLRLKPIIKVGLNGIYYAKASDSLIEKEILVEPFLEIYYFIPILKKYSLKAEGSLFWRSDVETNFIKENAQWQWDFSLEYKPTDEGIKVIAKYSFGVNGLTYERDDKLMLGLAYDLIGGNEGK